MFQKLFPVFRQFLSPFNVEIVSFLDLFDQVNLILEQIIVLLYFLICFRLFVSCHVCIVENYLNLFSQNFGRIFESLKSVFKRRKYSFLQPVGQRLNFLGLLGINFVQLENGKMKSLKFTILFGFFVEICFFCLSHYEIIPRNDFFKKS